MVVGDEDPRDERDRHQAASAGTSSRTSTPPGAAGLDRERAADEERALAHPAQAAAAVRRRGLGDPAAVVDDAQDDAVGAGLERELDRLACAWRATFVRLSCVTR